MEKVTTVYANRKLYMEMYYQKAWKTTKEVNEKFDSLNSESGKKEAVKEQIKMRTDGLGWKEQCHHPWSKKGETYAADVLKKHLIDTILPYEHKMKAENKIPKVPKVELPSSKIKNLKL